MNGFDDGGSPRAGEEVEAVPPCSAAIRKSGRRKRKLRSRAVDDDLDSQKPVQKEEDVNGDDSVFDELEAAAGNDSARDRGSREAKRKLADALAAEEAAAEAQKKRKYEQALEKANREVITAQEERVAAAAAAASAGPESEPEWSDDEEEDILQALNLARLARQGAATRKTPIEDELLVSVEGVTAKTSEEAQQRDVVVATETNAFLDALMAEEQAQVAVKEEDVFFAEAPDTEEARTAREPDTEPMDAEDTKPGASSGWEAEGATGWTQGDAHPAAETAELRNGAGATSSAMPPTKKRRYRGRTKEDGKDDAKAAARPPVPDPTALFEAQQMLGRGLAETLVMLRERGWLHGVEYSGRQSDFKGNQQKQVEEALLGDETALSHRVGASLQRTDEFGRILTPKEAFRDVSYAFHGYHRAASKTEKSFKKLQRDRAQSGLINEKDVPYSLSRNVSQLVDDFKARKWKPKYVKGRNQRKDGGKWGRGKPGAKGGIDRFIEQAAAAAKQEAAAAAKAVPRAATAANGSQMSSEEVDRKLMPPPPPPSQL